MRELPVASFFFVSLFESCSSWQDVGGFCFTLFDPHTDLGQQIVGGSVKEGREEGMVYRRNGWAFFFLQ